MSSSVACMSIFCHFMDIIVEHIDSYSLWVIIRCENSNIESTNDVILQSLDDLWCHGYYQLQIAYFTHTNRLENELSSLRLCCFLWEWIENQFRHWNGNFLICIWFSEKIVLNYLMGNYIELYVYVTISNFPPWMPSFQIASTVAFIRSHHTPIFVMLYLSCTSNNLIKAVLCVLVLI